ncbi:MAG: hypothetical protein LAO19_06010 [Acidobacteriia bacterium]|nr:hypothetical protein [Terriglobia bacterium]
MSKRNIGPVPGVFRNVLDKGPARHGWGISTPYERGFELSGWHEFPADAAMTRTSRRVRPLAPAGKARAEIQQANVPTRTIIGSLRKYINSRLFSCNALKINVFEVARQMASMALLWMQSIWTMNMSF